MVNLLFLGQRPRSEALEYKVHSAGYQWLVVISMYSVIKTVDILHLI